MDIVVIKIPKNDFEKINEYLECGDLKALWLDKNSDIISLFAKFDDEHTANLHVYTEDENILCSIYLYDKENKNVDIIESDSGIDSLYELIDNKRINLK